MEFKTLFRAYRLSEKRKRWASISYNGTYGIAVSDKPSARKWQRYDRLSRRIEARVEGERVCPVCVAPNNSHYSSCPKMEADYA